ncbi:MAG: DUF4012 domain-containing protein [Patescibacteria group bacterium]
MKKYLSRTLKTLWFLIKYGLLTLAGLVIIILIILSGAYRDLKNAAQAGLAGKAELSAAINVAQEKNWAEAENSAARANDLFNTALNELEKSRTNFAIAKIAPVRAQVNDLEYLLKTTEILSRSMKKAVPIIKGWDDILANTASHKFSDLPAEEKGRFLQAVYESEPEINGLKANLDLAVLNLDKIHKIGVLWPVYSEISDIKQELEQATVLMDKATTLVKMIPALAGYPNSSRFLLVLQNNDELRPSGGFIGVYGILESRNGEIVYLKTNDSYHLDMPASLNNWDLEPPMAIKKYLAVEKWYLRDANWSPDWPTSAQQIEKIFNGELQAAGETPDNFTGIIAINPDLIADLLRLVGPITIDDETYTPDNFQPLLQYNVEIAYKEKEIRSWDRKEIINELVGEIKERLFGLPLDGLGELLKIASDNIDSKNLQIYFKNNDWQKLAGDLGADGRIRDFSGDYFLVVDSNLGALKSDAVIKKEFAYTMTAEKEGNPKAALKLTYKHEGGFDWRTTRYRTYTRLYAPLGSRLLSLEGLDEVNADFSTEDDLALNKTVFAFFWNIEPGTTGQITINYLLPETIKTQIANDEYRLLVQKQSGQRVEALNVSLEGLKRRPLQWTTNLETEKVFYAQ